MLFFLSNQAKIAWLNFQKGEGVFLLQFPLPTSQNVKNKIKLPTTPDMCYYTYSLPQHQHLLIT